MSVPQRAVQLTEPSEFLKEHPEVQFVDLLIADMNGVVRGKRIERNSLNKVFEKGINLPASLFALDITGSTVESTGLGLDIGDADRICYPIPGTLSMEPWQKRPTAQLLMTMHELEGEPFFADNDLRSYFAVRLDGDFGAETGVLAVVDDKPFAHPTSVERIMRFFIDRISAELTLLHQSEEINKLKEQIKRSA